MIKDPIKSYGSSKYTDIPCFHFEEICFNKVRAAYGTNMFIFQVVGTLTETIWCFLLSLLDLLLDCSLE